MWMCILCIAAVCVYEFFPAIYAWICSIASRVIWLLSFIWPRAMSSISSQVPTVPTIELTPVLPLSTIDTSHIHPTVKTVNTLETVLPRLDHSHLTKNVEIPNYPSKPVAAPIPEPILPKDSMLRKAAIKIYEQTRAKNVEVGRTNHHVFHTYSLLDMRNKTPRKYADLMELELLKHNDKYPEAPVDCLSSMDIMSTHQNHNFPAHLVIRVKDEAPVIAPKDTVKLTSMSTMPVPSHQVEVKYKYLHILYPTLNVTDYDANTGLPVHQFSYYHAELNDHCREETENYDSVKIVEKSMARWNHVVGFYTDLDGQTQVSSFYGYAAACLQHCDDIFKGRWTCTNKPREIPPIPRLIINIEP
jgi:hypothetical protein